MLDVWRGVKALIAEDHELYRDGLRLLLNDTIRDVTSYIAPDFPQAMSILRTRSDIGLALFDLKLPGTKDLEGLTEIRRLFPTLTIIVISTLDFEVSIRKMIDLGVNGFIAKSTPKEEMKEAIQEILNGHIVIKSERDIGERVDLSRRQVETLRLLAEGLSNKEIARKLDVSPATVKEYVSKIIDRMNVVNRTQAVLAAQRHGLLLDYLHV